MNNLIKGGIYSFPYANTYYVFIKELKHNEVLFFKVSEIGHTREEMVNILTLILKVYPKENIRDYFGKMGKDEFQNTTDGFLGVISEEMLEELERLRKWIII